MNIRREIRIIGAESRMEIVKLFRTPAFLVPTVTFPVIFYLFFGIAFSGAVSGLPMRVYLLATYGAFGIIGASLSAFGAAIAFERRQGWLQLKQATPMPLRAYFIAKLAAAMLFSLLIVALLLGVGSLAGATLTATQSLTLLGALVAGTIPFALMGITLGYIASPHAVIALLNLIYLPMAFLSGLWVPIDFLPGPVRSGAEFLPAYHLGQLALELIGAPHRGNASGHVVALAGFAAIFLATAIVAYGLDRRRNYA